MYTMKSHFNQNVLNVLKSNPESLPWYKLLLKIMPNFDKLMFIQFMIDPIHSTHV